MSVSPIGGSKPINVDEYVSENKSASSCEVAMPDKFEYLEPKESGISSVYL